MISSILLYIAFFLSVFFGVLGLSQEQEIAFYQTNGDSIILESGTGSEQAEDIWNTFVTIVPVNWRNNIDDFRVIDMPLDETYAYMLQDDDQETLWDMTINLGFINSEIESGMSSDEAVTDTLIHELAHIIALRDDQMEYTSEKDTCTVNSIEEGCLNKDSYLSLFIDAFWLDAQSREDAYNGEDIYTDHEDDFINDYAATNPEEDFAESFMYFILYDWPEENSPNIYDQKILFFSQFPELVELANTIVSNLYQNE